MITISCIRFPILVLLSYNLRLRMETPECYTPFLGSYRATRKRPIWEAALAYVTDNPLSQCEGKVFPHCIVLLFCC